VQYHNWWLRYLISQEGIPLHVEPGNIFRRIGGTKMIEEVQEDEIKEVEIIDEDGKIRKVYYI
jgi:hypothetical protein